MAQTLKARSDQRSVMVPARLARPLALLAVTGARVIQERDGGLPLTAGMADLLAELATAASGGPVPTVGPGQARWLSVAEAAMQSGLSARRVRELAAAGRLICKRVDRRTWLIDADSLPAKGRQSVA